MVVVLSLSANVQFCPSKMLRTRVTCHATNLLLSEITVWHAAQKKNLLPDVGEILPDRCISVTFTDQLYEPKS